MDCKPPGFSLQRISQARIPEWVAISFSRGSSWRRDRTHISCITSGVFTDEPPGKPHFLKLYSHIDVILPYFRKRLWTFPFSGQGGHPQLICMHTSLQGRVARWPILHSDTSPPPLTLCSPAPTLLSCPPLISLSVPHVPLPHRGLCFCPSLLSEAAPFLSQIQWCLSTGNPGLGFWADRKALMLR